MLTTENPFTPLLLVFFSVTITSAQHLVVDGDGIIGSSTAASQFSPRLVIKKSNGNTLQLVSDDEDNWMSFFNNEGYVGYSGIFNGRMDMDFGTGSLNALGKVHLVTERLPRVTLIPSGNLGIGTQNPPALLSVRTTANDTSKLLNFSENDNLSFFYEAGFAGTGPTGNTLKLNTFAYSNTQNAMTWRGDGNVGIGITDPSEKLDVDGNVKIDGRIDMNAGATNIFIGENVAESASPQESVIIGYDAGRSLTTGVGVTFIGKDAGRIATEGLQNVAVGTNSAEAMTTESYGVYVGTFAGSSAAGDYATFVGYNANSNAALSNVTAIGSHAVVTTDNTVVLGNVAQSNIRAYGNLSSVSDGRFKKNIRENVMGLDFIMGLRPVTYQFDAHQLDNSLRKSMKKNKDVNMTNYHTALTQKSNETFTGFIAQEVEDIMTKKGFNFSGLVKPKNSNDHYGLRYAEFVVPLVKAVQEQQTQIEAQEQVIAQLKSQLNSEKSDYEALQSRLSAVELMLDQILKQEENNGSTLTGGQTFTEKE